MQAKPTKLFRKETETYIIKEKINYSANGDGKQDIHLKKTIIIFIIFQTVQKKMNSKGTKTLNLKPEPLKLLDKSLENDLEDIGSGRTFWTERQQHQASTDGTVWKWSSSTTKEIINRAIRHAPTEQEKIFPSYSSVNMQNLQKMQKLFTRLNKESEI